jgi:hypothetical protein
MDTLKKESDKAVSESGTADDASVENSDKKNSGRRLQDSLESKDPSRKFNVDRRSKGSDRRQDTDPNYNGPARRLTIDRRINTKDRREEKE